MTLDQFNGVVRLVSLIRQGSSGDFEIKANFFDKKGLYNASHVSIGDVIYIRGYDGKAYRLSVKAIISKSYSNMNLIVTPDSPIIVFPIQMCVIVRETKNWKYPMFPQDTPKNLLSFALNHYAILADRIDNSSGGGSCPGNLILAKDVKGSETVCLENSDGTKSKITLEQLKEYFLTIHTEGGNVFRLDVSDNGFMDNIDKTTT